MNNRERVIASLSHQQPDWTPFNISFTQESHRKMVAFYGDPDFTSRLDNCLCILGTQRPAGGRCITPDIFEDEFGVQWDKSVDKDIGVVCNRAATPETLADYQFPDPDDPSRFAGYAGNISKYPGRFVVSNVGFSLFERAWTLAGMENILTDMIANPDFVHALLDRILAYNLKIIGHACDETIDAMLFGDDWGQQSGLIMGPRMWREFIKPRLAQMYSAVKAKHKYVMIHCCGKVDEILPELIEIGLDCFNPFQPEVMDVYEIKKRYGSTLSFYGGISTQKTLPFGTVQQTKDEVRRLIEHIGKDGGYIAAPAHSIPADAKPENIAAMIEVLQNQ